MARTATRRHKGCALCKPYKDCRVSPAEKQPWRDKRAIGKKRRITRREVGDQ